MIRSRVVASAAIATLVVLQSPALADLAPHRLVDQGHHIAIGGAVEVLEDPGGALTFEDAVALAARGSFRTVGDGEPSLGFSDSAYWFHFVVENVSSAESEWLLEIAYPLLDRVQVYVQNGAGELLRREVGDTLPFASREIEHRNFVLAIPTPRGSPQDIFLRVETESSVQVPLHLWTRAAFADATYRGQLWLGIFYGIGLVMVAYNLLLFLAIRARSYLYFCGVALSYILVQASLDGFTFQYLWPQSPGVNATSLPISIAACCGLCFAFTREFLLLRSQLPHWDRVLQVAIGISVALAGLALLAPYAVSIRAAAGYAGISSVGAAVLGVVSWRTGYRAARFFVLAWGIFLIFSLALVLAKFGLLGISLVTVHGPQIGFVTCVVLLTLALVDRLNIATAESARAQREALEIQRHATATLEAEVEAQTQELRVKADQLREANSQRTRFFQNVSHELRTPVTLILSSLDKLQRSATADASQVAIASRNAQRLLKLVNELLELQKLSAGKRELRLVPIDLGAFIEHCLEYVIGGAADRNIDLQYRNHGDDPVIVMAEADALEKVVFNYLSNALKYTPKGGAITVELVPAPDQQTARVVVSDGGPGIPAELQDQLFRVFSQIESGEHARSEGTGLGLALVKELTHAMGGQVGVDSEPGRGSSFWAELPAAHGVTTADVAPVASETSPRRPITEHAWPREDDAADGGVPTGPEGGELILVADDLPDMRALIRGALERHGFRTMGATSGVDALQRAAELTPSAIVSDWMMPGMTGPALIQKLRKVPELASTPVVLLTAKSDTDSRLEGTEAGADGFLGKPFEERELISVIRNLLQLKAREREVDALNRNLRQERDALARAKEQNDELSRFIVHDLKNPLTIISVNLEILLDDDSVPADARGSVVDALNATEALTRMVFDLLDVSRGEERGLVLQRATVPIAQLFRHIETQMARWLARTNHRLDLEIGAREAYVDSNLAVRVLSNLIDNAAKYSPPGSPIRVEAIPDGSGTLIRVCDQGPSIPAEQREQIFEKYHRIERGNPAVDRMSRGLGLVFCRMVAEAHGGSIWAEPNQPEGNRFCLRLPGKVPDQPLRAPATATAREQV